MKRIAIISALAVFLFTNYAYATLDTEKLAQTIERAQYGELTQEDAEEFLIAIINTINPELSEEIAANQQAICYLSGFFVIILALIAIFFGGIELLATIVFIIWDILCVPFL